jgi:CubicO group peptidase (beta-lactamase class C family)
VQGGELVVEQYASELDAGSTLISWSMAKSITHALLGTLVRDDKLDIHQERLVPAWSEPGDPRSAITLDHMLRMVDGLDFVEDYIDSGTSDVIEMLFASGKEDVAGYTEARKLLCPPGSRWNYSSGTTNVISAIIGRAVGGGQPGMLEFMQRELFDRIGMRSATARFDAAGHFIGSSFVFATARDFARFGLLYLRDGCWDGARILPDGWVDYARTATAVSGGEYGAHWWISLDGSAVFHCSGYRGQFIALDPERDLVVVRLGGSTSDQRGAVYRQLRALIQCFPKLDPA